MRPKRKHVIFSVVSFILVIALMGLYLAYCVPPTAWSQIHIGDSAAEVRAKCPGVIQDLHDVKGDFCFRELLMGRWRLQIVYGPDDRVSAKYCILRLGARNDFKDFHFDN